MSSTLKKFYRWLTRKHRWLWLVIVWLLTSDDANIWYINTTGLAITFYESQMGSSPPFSPPQWMHLFWFFSFVFPSMPQTLMCPCDWCDWCVGVLVNSCNSREIYTYKVCMSCFLFRTQWNDIYCKDTRRIKVSNLREIAVSGDYGLGAKGSQKIVECSSSVTTCSSWCDGVSLICKIDTNPIVSARKCNHCA